MPSLSEIPDIDHASLDLIEAAGFLNTDMLAKAKSDELLSELTQANKILKITKETPSQAQIASWINHARSLSTFDGKFEREEISAQTISSQEMATDDRRAIIERAPLAIPMSTRLLAENDIPVGEIPIAIFLDECPDGITVRSKPATNQKLTATPSPVPAAVVEQSQPSEATSYVQLGGNHSNRLQIDKERVKPIDALAGPAPSRSTLNAQNERVALLRTPRVETNRGISPESRRFVRGVLHTHPMRLALAAMVTLTTFLLFPISVFAGILFICARLSPIQFGWVPDQVLVFPLLLPIAAAVYLMMGYKGSCRICGQRLFFPRKCLKNSKAHHISGLGYIIPVCLHMLLFKWFRCTYCATPVRLKE